MRMQTRSKKILRSINRLTLGTIAVTLLLAIAGTIYQTAATETDQNRFPPPGNLVDVDGFKMHIYCNGEGSPTVILDHAGDGSSMDWALIQPRLAEHTRVCSYDRAGRGWSEYNPAPRTLTQQAHELHTLLDNANEQGPYILVAHSYGARVARVYASQYPNDIVGMVLMDPGILYDDPRYPQQALDDLESENKMIHAAEKLTPYGLTRLLQPMMGKPTYDLPEEAVRANATFSATEVFWRSIVDQSDILPDVFIEEHNVTTLGNIPLLVLISDEPDDEIHRVYTQANIEMSELSPKGRYQIVEGAEHFTLVYRNNDASTCTDGILSILNEVRAEKVQ